MIELSDLCVIIESGLVAARPHTQKENYRGTNNQTRKSAPHKATGEAREGEIEMNTLEHAVMEAKT